MMEVVEMDGQGRIYIPSEVRAKLAYTKFRLIIDGDKMILIPLKPSIEKFYGIAGKPQYSTPEEVDEAVKRETEKIARKEVLM